MYKEHDPPQAAFEQADMFGYVPAMTQCGFCDKVIPLSEATKSEYVVTPTYREHEHFCCDDHAIKYWNRRSGL